MSPELDLDWSDATGKGLSRERTTAISLKVLEEVTDRGGHLGVDFVEADTIHALNLEHRQKDSPTDVLSFPLDGVEGASAGPRELGDVVICPEHTQDLAEALVHGILHLFGHDHEADSGEMLALQDEIVAGLA